MNWNPDPDDPEMSWVVRMLPWVTDIQKLEEVAFLLNLEVPAEALNKKMLYRLITSCINSEAFDELHGRREILTRITRLLKVHLRWLGDEEQGEEDEAVGEVGDQNVVPEGGIGDLLGLGVFNGGPAGPADGHVEPAPAAPGGPADPVINGPVDPDPAAHLGLLNPRRRLPATPPQRPPQLFANQPRSTNPFAADYRPFRPYIPQRTPAPLPRPQFTPGLYGTPFPGTYPLGFDPLRQSSPSGTAHFVGKLRELKIDGEIGVPSQKSKDKKLLSYSSLAYQISNAVECDYKEPQICAAVIKAIQPDLSLRTYLESKGKLTLPIVNNALRAFYREKDATSVFNQMNNEVQKADEDELGFCMRLMGLRDKVLALSKLEGVQYSMDLVQRQFQHSLEVGLKNEPVRSQLYSLLKTKNVDDDVLVERLSELVMNETEHSSKVGSKTKKADVDSVTDPELASKLQTAEMLKEMRKLTAQVNQMSNLKTDFEKLKQMVVQQQWEECPREEAPAAGQVNGAHGGGNNVGGGNNTDVVHTGQYTRGGYGGRGRGRGGARPYTPRVLECRNCHQTGTSSWDHCFVCCGQGHRSELCPNNNLNGGGQHL